MSDTEPCKRCNNPVNTMPGIDSYVQLREYTTTNVTTWVFCSSACLEKELLGGTNGE